MASVRSEDISTWLRVQLILALASDDLLVEMLALKGGNALNLVHHVGNRTSLDLDYSLTHEIADLDDAKRRLFAALRERLGSRGYVLFDERFGPKPADLSEEPKGYAVEFKITTREQHEKAGNLAALRRSALTIDRGGQSERIFKIEISRHEYCEAREEHELEGLTFYIYTLPLIAAEKLRSVCQQMPTGGRLSKPTPRARDFYDIHAIVTERSIDLLAEENVVLIRRVFVAKLVPLQLLSDLERYREFHREEWPRVRNAVGAAVLQSYDFYFDFVLELVRRLQALRMEDTP